MLRTDEEARGGEPRALGAADDEQAELSTLAELSPLRRARAELLARLLGERGAIYLDAGRPAAYTWQQRGLTLAQRDRAADDLVRAGVARLDTTGALVRLEPSP